LRGLGVRARERPDHAIAGAIGKPTGGEAEAARRADMLGHNRADDAIGGLNTVDALLQEKAQVALATDEGEAAIVFVELGGIVHAVVSAFAGFQFGHDVADARVRGQVDAAIEPDTNLGAVVAAQHGAVLEESDLQPKARGRQCCAGSRDAAADDYEVVLAAVFGHFRQAERLAAQGRQRGQVVRRLEVQVRAEENGVAASLEAGQVVQGDLGLAADLDDAAVLPMPFGAFGAEGGRKRLPVEEDLEPAGRAGRFPGGDPIARADPDAVFAFGREPGSGLGVADRLAQTVRKEIGRAHLIHELLIHNPATQVSELLGFEEDDRDC